MDCGQEEVVLEELAAGEGEPHVDQPDPFDDLEHKEANAESGCQECIPHCNLIAPGTSGLDAASDRPRTRQEEDRGEHSEPEREVRLGLEESFLVLGSVVEIDAEVGREDEGFEEDEEPHVRLPGNVSVLLRAGRRHVLSGRHDAASAAGGHDLLGRSGIGPRPKSSRRISSGAA